MKKLIIISILFLTALNFNSNAQNRPDREMFGNTLNLGAGVGYYGYVGQVLPIGMVNYEFDVVRNFTLAPFAGIYSYQRYYHWGNPDVPHYDQSYRYYSYRVTNVPVGMKGTYYFDELFHTNSKWDFYAAASIGFIFRKVVWESDYYGDKQVYHSASPLYADAHIGLEYHVNAKLGLFADASTGVSTVGLAIHF